MSSESAKCGGNFNMRQLTEKFRITFFESIDLIVQHLKWRFEALQIISEDFRNIKSGSASILLKHAINLAVEYAADLSP